MKEEYILKIGDKVLIKNGATDWMKQYNYWLDTMPNNIDGMEGTIINDYTNFKGNDCHFEVDIGLEYGIGIHPQWLETNS